MTEEQLEELHRQARRDLADRLERTGGHHDEETLEHLRAVHVPVSVGRHPRTGKVMAWPKRPGHMTDAQIRASYAANPGLQRRIDTISHGPAGSYVVFAPRVDEGMDDDNWETHAAPGTPFFHWTNSMPEGARATARRMAWERMPNARLARVEATAPDGGPGDAVSEHHGPHGFYAVWPKGDGRVFVTRHDPETGDALDHFSHERLDDSYYFSDPAVARFVAERLATRGKVRLSRDRRVPLDVDQAALVKAHGKKRRPTTPLLALADWMMEKHSDAPAGKWFAHVLTHPKAKVIYRGPSEIPARFANVSVRPVSQVAGHPDVKHGITPGVWHRLDIEHPKHSLTVYAPVDSRPELHEAVDDFVHPNAWVRAHETADRWADEHGLAAEVPQKLARVQAPAGGAVVNNQYRGGGEFLASPLKRIRAVAPLLKRLRVRATGGAR